MIWVEDGQIYTHFGALSGKGQTKLKATSDPEGDVLGMIAKKKKEGYAQTGGKKAVKPSPQLDAKALKKHIAAITDDPATALVLADWLQGQQHPWGELIALQVGAATNAKKAPALEKAAAKLLEKDGETIFPALANAGTHVTWKHGFVDRGQIGSDGNPKALLAAAKEFLASPAAARLDTLVFAPVQQKFSTWRSWERSERNIVDPWADLEKLAGLVPDRVTKLGFGPWPAVAAGGYTYVPTATKLNKAVPDVTSLELTGSMPPGFGKLALPKLTSLAVRIAHATDEQLTAIAQAKLPKLERLEVGTGGYINATVDEVHPPDEWTEDDEDASRYPDTFSADDLEEMSGYDEGLDSECTGVGIKAIVDAKWPATLTHLSFHSSNLDTTGIAALLASKLLAQLKTLDLSNAGLGEDQGKALAAAKKALAHLESIDLSRNKFSEPLAKKLAAIPNVKIDKPKKDESNNADFYFRYVATVE